MTRSRSAFIQALEQDNSLPISSEAVALWLKDLDNPFRWSLRPLLQLVFAVLLHLTWFLKRLPLPQFRAHKTLQFLICWFCKHFVSVEANLLILRHYATESNLLNFLIDNSPGQTVKPLALYPKSIDDMRQDSFVEHDQELFRAFRELGPWEADSADTNPKLLKWDNWHKPKTEEFEITKRWSQVIDFETSHALFMCLFCLLLTREEYRDAINGFNLDQSIAIRIGQLIGDPSVVEMAYNKFPLYLVGPWNLTQRFLMHGIFTECLHERLEQIRNQSDT